MHICTAATGAIEWTFTPTNTTEGFPSGVSLDGEFVFTARATGSASASTGSRAQIDKTTGGAVWEHAEGASLYGCPGIGNNFLFIPQNSPAGVLVVDKGSGSALYNFASIGVGSVPQHVTVTCDNYLFAGDRNGKWWVLDVNDASNSRSVQFNGIVNGTALATDPSGGDYAVVSIRSGNAVDGGGYVAAFALNSSEQPHVEQNVANVDINVIPGTGAGNPYTLADALTNAGCVDLHITSHNLYDPAPDDAALSFRNTQSRYAAALANTTIGSDYTAYFDESSKRAMMARQMADPVDGELTRGDVALEQAARALTDSKRADRQMAASQTLMRTSGVTYSFVIPPGNTTDVSWVYAGTGLARGTDVEADGPERSSQY